MSYHIHLYRKEVKKSYKTAKKKDFFEDESNFIQPFTTAEKEQLKKSLIAYKYVINSENENEITLSYQNEDDISAILTKNALYFRASGDNIFEIMMTASELVGENYAKFDPQTGKWE
jgi:hypothetical protein